MEQYSTQALITKGADTSGMGTDKAKLARYLMMSAVGLGISFLVYKFIMPWFVDFVWDLTQIIIYGGIGAILLAFLLSQWSNITSFFDILADNVLGKQIRMAPFRFQERKLENAQANASEVEVELGKLKGAYQRVDTEYQRQVQLAKEGEAGEKLQNITDEERSFQTTKKLTAISCIQTMQTQRNNMAELVDVVAFGLKKTKQMIKQLGYRLNESKMVFEVTMTGREAMTRMQKAMQGDTKLNSDAERSAVEIARQIALAVGQTQASMDIVKEITRGNSIDDAAKIAVAKKQLEAIGAADVATAIPMMQGQGNLLYAGTAKAMSQQFPD